MRHLTLLFCCSFFQLLLHGQPLPCRAELMTSTCQGTCIICNLNGFSGRNPSGPAGNPPPRFAGDCTEIAHNIQWIAFRANSAYLTIELLVSNCKDDFGLEYGLYEGNNCEGFAQISRCYGGVTTVIKPGKSGFLRNTEPLTNGRYWLYQRIE